MRFALISQVPQAVHGYTMGLRAFGHEVAGVLCVRTTRYSGLFGAYVEEVADGRDVVIPSSRDRIAPLLRALEPDAVLCAGFPWVIPADALAVAPLGFVNGHPSLLPRYRGPIPVAWAIRRGEAEIGMTLHRMDPGLDTGNILGQVPFTLADEHGWDELGPRLTEAVGQMLPAVLDRLERGDPGDPQDEGRAEYLSFFEPEYVEIDWSRPREEVARQVRAWRFATTIDTELGALAELDGERVRVLRVSLEPGEGREVECADGPVWVVETEPLS
jgi:methionyl-tRNA formyltransferase